MTVLRRGVVAMALAFGLASGAGAALIDKGNETVLDTSTNLLWLKDANYADTELDAAGRIAAIIANVGSVAGHTLVAGDFNASTGRMTWWGAMAWAQDPTFAGYSDWRLPKVTDTGAPGCDFSYNNTDCSFNVDPATGEMARLWDVSLGNTPYYDTSANPTGCSGSPPYCFTNQSPFVNAQSYVVLVGHGVRARSSGRVGLRGRRRQPGRGQQGRSVLCLGCAPGRCRRRPGTRYAGARRAGVGGARHRRQGTSSSVIRRFGRFGSFGGCRGVSPLRR